MNKHFNRIFVTSDQHFGHTNIIKLSNRPFDTIEAMDEALIKAWNKTVGENDVVFHLGDFAFKCGSDRLKPILGRVNGKIYLLLGNHDKKDHLKISGRFQGIKEYHEINIDKTNIVLFHYPLESWHWKERGAYHLHGHTHNNLRELKNRLDVGVDSTHAKGFGFRPLSLEEAIKYLDETIP